MFRYLVQCVLLLFFTNIAYAQSVQMDIDGALQMHHEGEVIQAPGTIRWSECDHEVWNGTDWVSMTSGEKINRQLLAPKSDGSEEGNSVAVDSENNLYLVGEYNESLLIGGTTINSTGLSDIFIAKYDQEGNFIWTRSIGGTGSESVNDIEFLNGAVYLTGTFSLTCSFGDTSVTSNGTIDIFIAKYKSDGDLDWLRTAGSHTNDIGKCVEIDETGFIYVSGLFQSTVNFGGQVLTSLGSFDIFYLKLDQEGNFIWVKKMGGSSLEIVNDFHFSSNDELLLVGRFPSTNFMVDGQTLVAQDGADAYLVKLDINGNLIFAKSVGGPEDQSFNSVNTDSQGNIIIVGEYEDTISFQTDTFTSIDGKDIILAKFNSSGDEIWIKSFGGPSYDVANQINFDQQEYILISGYFSDSLSFEQHCFVSQGSADIIVAKFDSSGNFQSLKQFGGESFDIPNKCLINKSQIYLTGHISSPNIFFGTHNVGNVNSKDLFMYKFSNF